MNIEKAQWGSSDFADDGSEADDETYSVVEQTDNAPVKSQPLNGFERLQRNGKNFMRDSLVGFRDGIPGTFSGYRENKIRASIKAKQPFFGDNDNYLLVTDVHTSLKPKLEAVYDEVTPDDDYPVDFSSHFKPRFSIKNQHVVIAAGLDNSHVETGMRFYDPANDCPRQASSSFVVPLSNEDNMSELSWNSDAEHSFEQSAEFIPADDEIYEAIGTPRTSLKGGTISGNVHCPDLGIHGDRRGTTSGMTDNMVPGSMENEYANVNYENVKKMAAAKLPRLPPRNSIVYYSEDDKETYFEVELKEQVNSVKLPPLKIDSSEYQIKRYQLIKCIMENEYAYMKSLRRLVKEYEEPLLENGIVSQDRVKSIFKHVHEIMQCHQLFNMALSYRANEWEKNEVIGDVILASFSKAMVFKAYCKFVCSFSVTMDSLKETCKSVPAFFKFLKNKEYDRKTKQSLYYLMCQPLEYIPNLVLVMETLLEETPFPHEDRLPLQMALTHLECLCETLANERMKTIMKEKVKVLESQCIGFENELASPSRHFIRYDDMLLCETENGNLVKTKPHRIFLLNDLIICASYLSKRQQMQLMTNKIYKVKWCHSISNVNIVDVTSGIYINTDANNGSGENSYQIFKGSHHSKYMEDLLHDLTIVGDMMGKVSSLRLSHTFIDSSKVNEWYKDIHTKLDSVMEMANMNWIEISVPSSSTKGEKEEWLFNVPSPRKKFEWSTEFENINLRLSGDNNPGWYLQEENIYEHEVVNLQRALPLIASVQPLFMINPETSVQCVLDLTAITSTKPILWIFSGNEKLGVITMLEMKPPSTLHVLHSYIACNERVCAAEIVMKREDPSRSEECPFVWIGTLSGRILIYNALDVNERQPMMSASLEDSIVSMKYINSMVFVGLANGNLLRFTLDSGPTWDISNPTIVSLSTNPVMSMIESCDSLWCASGSAIYIVDIYTMNVEEEVAACENRKGTIRQMIAYGIGVWVSMRKSSILLLYHGETKEQLQMINTTTPIARMKKELEGPIQEICIDNIYVTTILAKEGLLWVGVDQGLIVTYPLPKLGGIPIVSGKACVSFHAHGDTVKHLHAFNIQRYFQRDDNDYIEAIEEDNSSIESIARVSRSSGSKNGGNRGKNDKNSSDPAYFVLEYNNEPLTETSSLSLSDNEEVAKLHSNKDAVLNKKEEVHKSEIRSTDEISTDGINARAENGGIMHTDKEKEAIYAADKADFSDLEAPLIDISNGSKDDALFVHDFYFVEDGYPAKDMTADTTNTLSVNLASEQTSVDELSSTIPVLQNDGFVSMMENFKGFHDSSHKPTAEMEFGSKYDNVPKIEEVRPPSGEDVPKKVEIPMTFPTKRRHKRVSGVRTVNIPATNETKPSTHISVNKTADLLVGVKQDIPNSFFVQGESFSAYDVSDSFGNNDSVTSSVEGNARTNDDIFEKNSTEDLHIYEVPLKVCNDVYATLQNEDTNMKQPLIEKVTSSVSLPGLGRPKSEKEFKNKTIPTHIVSKPEKSNKRNSLASCSKSSFDSTEYIPPLRRKQAASVKGSESSMKDGGTDLVKNFWYVISIGSGHIDLRKATKYSEHLELSNSPSYQGREAMLLLWKLNAGNHFYR